MTPTNDPPSETGEHGDEVLAINVERDAYVANVMNVALPAPAPLPPPHTLPPDVAGFVGRGTELEELDQLIGSSADEPVRVIAISAVSGTAGVGKTALAVHWAHRVSGKFPGGHLYVDLQGYGPDQPLRAGEVLAAFLRELGVDGAQIPFDTTERSALFRTLSYERTILLLLDNAYNSEQVRPLLPSCPSCCVIVTSRDDLAGLRIREGAHSIDLDVLPDTDSLSLLRMFVGPRVDTECDAAKRLAEYCSHLPLALRVAAQLIRSRQSDSLENLATELRSEQLRLARLKAGGDVRTEIRAVFSWSYRHLHEDAARAFRLLGLHPGRGFDDYAIGALIGCDLERARDTADTLRRASLIQRAAQQRFTMHDLLRAYASQLATEHDGQETRQLAAERLLTYYTNAAVVASRLLFPGERKQSYVSAAPGTALPTITASAEAKAWLDGERQNHVALTGYWRDYPVARACSDLAAALRRYLITGSHFDEALTVHRSILESARESSDRAEEANSLNSVAVIYLRQGRLAEARDMYLEALQGFRDVHDRAGEGAALGNLGSVELRLGNVEASIDYHRQSLTIRKEVSDRLGEGHTLNNLGFAYERLGRYGDALIYLDQSRNIFRELSDRDDESITLGNLGVVYRKLKRYDDARGCFIEALEISRETGDRAGEGDVLKDIGILESDQGKHQQGLSRLREALQIGREIGDKTLETESLNGLGDVFAVAGLLDEARESYEAAATIAGEMGNRHESARSLDGIAGVLFRLGDSNGAAEHWRSSLTIYLALGMPRAEEVRHKLEELRNDGGQDLAY